MDLKFQAPCLAGRQVDKLKTNKAFSLIEIIVVVFIMSVAFVAFYTVSTVGTKYIIESKNRLAAVALANEKMEIIRNLEYNNIGILYSAEIPGNIPASETVTANGRSYEVSTSVRYFDDPMDGEYPTDTIQNDYKQVMVTVSWNDSNGQSQSVSSASRFVPPGLETSVGGSPLSINVISNTGTIAAPVFVPVPRPSSIHITNNSVVPIINDTASTDPDGHIMFPSARISSGSQITITKTGYETIETMDSTAAFIPIYRHVDVLLGASTQCSFEQNELSNLIVKSADYQNNSVDGIKFSIGGGKLIGHKADIFGVINVPVYSMENTTGTTDSAGEKEYSNISPGNYTISMDSDPTYKFVDFEPSMSPAELNPGDNMTYTIRVANTSATSLFLTITDDAGNSVSGATAKLTDSGGSTEIFSGKTSSLRGVIFYPDGATPLVSGSYDLVVEAIGFETKTETITIIDGNITEINMQLTKST